MGYITKISKRTNPKNNDITRFIFNFKEMCVLLCSSKLHNKIFTIPIDGIDMRYTLTVFNQPFKNIFLNLTWGYFIEQSHLMKLYRHLFQESKRLFLDLDTNMNILCLHIVVFIIFIKEFGDNLLQILLLVHLTYIYS